MSQQKEVSKEEFKEMYFKYATAGDGWTEDYWNHFYEKEKEAKFFFTAPESSLHNRMFIMSGDGEIRMVFLTDESEESFFSDHSESNLFAVASDLVKRIPGTRKGSDIPAYTHSFRVHDILVAHGFNEETSLAGLLHDVIEDAEVTFEELKALGFSERIIELVDLCTHDIRMKDGDARWMKMVARLVDVGDSQAWAIKIADILDNVRGSVTMNPERSWFIKNVKAKLMFALTKDVEGVDELRRELEHEILLPISKNEISSEMKRKVDIFDKAFLDALNNVPKEDQY